MALQLSISDEVETLVRGLYAARDLPEAVSILFDTVLEPAGAERALALIEQDGELRGVLGMHWDGVDPQRLAIDLEDVMHPLVRAYGEADPSTVEYGDEEQESRSWLAFPLMRVREAEPFGMLIVAETGRLATEQTLRKHLSFVEPLLESVAERNRLHKRGQQIEQQRDLLTAIVNALPDPVLITDSENSVILENRRAELLFNTNESDSGGRRRAVEINNLLFSSFLTRSAIGGPDPAARELNLVDPSEGGDLLFEVLSTTMPSFSGDQFATVSVLRDVTDLKRATTELENQFKRVRHAEQTSRRERDRLNLILENVGDPILVTDSLSNIILLNREAERLFDIPPGTDLKSRRRQDVRANDTKFSSFVSDFALSGDSTRVVEFNLNEPDTGREFPAEVVSGKVMNERGEMAAIVSVLHDLTKQVENERLATELARFNEELEDRIVAATEELEERNRRLEWQSRELERAYRLKSQFLASMSHELRTPINALLGYTSLMRDHIYGELNKRQEEALDRMYTASQHLLELVNDVLDLAKIEAGKMPVHVEPVDIQDLIRELSQTIEPMVRRKELEYRVEVADDLPVLETDRTKVKQVLLNLMSNAVKFTHEGYIAVTASHQEVDGHAGVQIIVKDTGIGIDEDDLPKIFEDFRQIDQSSTREYGGTGLGLSITKKLLNLLGGNVHVESSRGGGSKFTVFLPRRSKEIVLDEDISRVAREADEAVITD